MCPEILRDEAVARLHQLGKVLFFLFLFLNINISAVAHIQKEEFLLQIVYQQSLVAQTFIEKD